jgi:trk system potassium uptake protein TrkH
VLGLLNFFLAAVMIIPLIISWAYREPTANAFLTACIVSILAGLALYLPFTRERKDLNRRQAFTIVTFGWISASVFGSIPFVLSGMFAHPVDAFFETISGFTTTGSSVLAAIDDLPRGILFWRSIIQWLGGMGIILLSIAILPFLGVGGMQLYRAEVPGPFPDKLKPRIAETAKILWQTYLVITLLEVILLAVGGMSVFDAFCHAFTTMATGGFSTRTESIGFYNSYHRIVITIFMFIAGTNFALHYRVMRGNPGGYGHDREFQFYLGLMLAAILMIFLVLLTAIGGN